MYQIISEVKQIRNCQNQLEKVLKKSLSHKGEFTIGFPGGNMTCPVWANQKIWYSTFEITKDDESTPRFWNGFGVTIELSKNKSNNIAVEINVPTEGIRKIVAGLFAKDTKTKKIFLLHRGRVGGGRKGIGKNAFLSWYPSPTITVYDEKEHEEQALIVGSINSAAFIDETANFIQNVALFREIVTSGEINESTFLSDEELTNRATESSSTLRPKKKSTKTETFERNPYVNEFAKRRAKGKCQLCDNLAPFQNKSGIPYLEAHHIIWLSEGGIDSIGNTAALCPNCHRKMHVLNKESDKKKLTKLAKTS